MSRTRKLTAVFLAYLTIGIAQVQLAPLSGGKLNPRAVGCPPYTHWDISANTCVDCDNPCLAGEELREDCGYSPEGYPIADPCRQCPNGTYNPSGGQKQCQDCKTCSSGYQQECTSEQPAVCLCKDDEELSPDGTTCQKICCFCQYEPSIEDTIDECHFRYPRTQYYCKKGSLSTGDTCKRPPQPTTTATPPPVLTAAPPLTTVKATGTTTNKTDAPPVGPTQPATPKPSPSLKPTAHTSGITPSSTAKGMSTVTPTTFPVPKGKQPTLAIVLGVVAACAVIGLICCGIRHWTARNAGTEGGEAYKRLENIVDEKEDSGIGDGEEKRGDPVVPDEDDPDKKMENSGGGDSGNVSNESSDSGSDKKSPYSSEDSLLQPGETSSLSSSDGQGADTQEAGGTKDNGETGDSDEETRPKEVVPEDTMEISGRIEGPPNDEKGRNAVPFGAGPNAANQQQQPQGGQPQQPPPYPGLQRQDGQPAVSISGGTFHGPVTFVVQGNDSHYHAAPGIGGQGQEAGNGGGGNGNAANGAAPRQADGRRQQPAQPDIGRQGGGDGGAGPNNAARPAHPPANGNDRVGNRRHQDIQVNIRPNPARPGQNVSFSCVIPDNLDPSTCEIRWRKQGQIDCVARVQNFNRTVQRCDAGVYTCEVTTPLGEVLDGQAELDIIEDNAEGRIVLPSGSRRPRENDDHLPTSKRPRTAGPSTSGAQGFNNPSGQIQVPDFIQHMPLEKILDNEDLLGKMKVKLERHDRHYRKIGSHFGLKHDEVDHIEFIELASKDSPFKAILEKVTSENDESENKASKKKMSKNKTVGELLQYCNETLKRRDVVRTVVEYFVENEQEIQESDIDVKENVTEKDVNADSQSEEVEECCIRDNVNTEKKELELQSTDDDVVAQETMSEPSLAKQKLGICDSNTFELVDMQP
ncbi:uncharacterized protein LOC144876147 isoform X2 [Branchiostoma floridae x Branchiostoma japonicum]